MDKNQKDNSKSHPAVRPDDGRLAENRQSMSGSQEGRSSQQSKSGRSSTSSGRK